MSFQLSSDIDSNKVFLVNQNELEGRFDPHFYKAEYLKIIKKLKHINGVTLKTLKVGVRKGVFDLSPNEYCESGVPFLRVSDLKEGRINFDKTVFISEKKHNEELYTEYLPNDLVISKVGTIGEVSILPTDYSKYNISQNIVGLKLNNQLRKNVIPAYLQTTLQTDFGIKQLHRQSTTGVQPKITLSAIRNIIVPILSIKNQEKIIKKIDSAYRIKKQKETQAQQLLDSIDNYLLGELGIKLPKHEENTLESRIFKRQLSEVSGGRLDALFHSESIYRFIDSGEFRSVPLNNKLIVYMKTGFAAGKQDQSTNETDIIQIRPTNVSASREYIFKRNIYIHRKPIIRMSDLLKKGEVLFNNTNSQELVGKSIYFDLDEEFYCSNHITRLLPIEKNLNAKFLVSILNLYQRKKVFYKICTNWNNQSGVNVNVLSKVRIPLPPIEKQTEIANKITEIRQQAKQLQQEAITDLEQAKKEVEAMILGEA